MLTTTPLPPTYTGGRVEVGEQSRSGGERPSGAGGEDAGSSGNLRRQLIKMQHSLKACLLLMFNSYTVESLNNGHIGTHHFVRYKEVVLFQRQKCIATI